MNTTFLINGGAGRIITAIPALEKYLRLNPKDDFKILIAGWECLLWSHPNLQDRTFSSSQKGLFDIIKRTKVVSPEPYHVHGYYNQQLSLAESFDEIINNTNDHSDIGKPNLYLSSYEKLKIKELISYYKKQTHKKKTVVFQPFGSAVELIEGKTIDISNRSLNQDDYFSIVKKLSEEYLVFYFGDNKFKHPKDNISISLENAIDLRIYMALISDCDYFVGVDSVGQHIARAFDKKGLVIMGSTFEKNVSYPDYFKFYRNKNKNPIFSPIRLLDIESSYVERMNDGILNFTESQISDIINIIKSDLGSEVMSYTKVIDNQEVKSSSVSLNYN